MATIDPEIKDYLQYDEGTGNFIWIKSPSRKVPAGSLAGSLDKDGYKLIRFRKVNYRTGRLAWWWVYGELLHSNIFIDHINRDVSDNSIKNLRKVSCTESAWNRGVQSNNTSGYKGVIFSRKKWCASIMVNGKVIRLGRFSSKEDASSAYKLAVRKYHTTYEEV